MVGCFRVVVMWYKVKLLASGYGYFVRFQHLDEVTYVDWKGVVYGLRFCFA